MTPNNTPDTDAVATAAAKSHGRGGKTVAVAKQQKASKPGKAAKAVTGVEAAAAPAPAKKAAAPEAVKAVKAKPAPKEKLVRDSFTMPQTDFALIAQLKTRALGFQRPTKKSELLRAGLQALSALNDEVLQAVLAQLPLIKTGRPRKGD